MIESRQVSTQKLGNLTFSASMLGGAAQKSGFGLIEALDDTERA